MFCEGRVVKDKSGSLFGKRALYRVKRAICFMKRALSHLQKRPSSWKEPYVSCKKLFYNIFCEGCVVKDKIDRHFSLQKKSPVFHEKSLAFHEKRHCNTLQHTATHCNTLHCNTLPVRRELFRKSHLVSIKFFGKSEKIHVFYEKSPIVAGLFFVYEESSCTRATLSGSYCMKRAMHLMKRALLL